MNNQFMANLKKAQKANDVRQAKLAKHFGDALDAEAALMGCGRECFQKAKADGKCPSEIFFECCNDGVIRVDFANVNTAAIVERTYGDVESLQAN
jgi:hypothetical protein